MNTKQLSLSFILIFCVVFLDRITKEIAQATLTQVTYIIPNVLFLYQTTNTGIAFGAFSFASSIITVLVFAIVLLGFFYLPKIPYKYHTATALLLGGAIGNVVDRILYGHVIDFIGISKFSIFNVADIAITIGVCILLYQFIREDMQQSTKKKK